MNKAIAIDFDGVLHSYTTPFSNEFIIPDPPVKGAKEFLTKAVENFDVYIYSCRLEYVEAKKHMMKWFLDHQFPIETLHQLKFSRYKPRADVYLDDKGLRFEGEFPTMDEIRFLTPWCKK